MLPTSEKIEVERQLEAELHAIDASDKKQETVEQMLGVVAHTRRCKSKSQPKRRSCCGGCKSGSPAVMGLRMQHT